MSIFVDMKCFYFSCLIFFATLASCGSEKAEDDIAADEAEVSSQNLDKQKISAQNVFNSIPSPTELGQLVDDAGLDYDMAMVNDPTILNKYTSDDFKAMNLGVYGADLAYANVHEQSSEAMTYLKCVNILCKNLGINEVFGQKTVDRLTMNKDNKDSLLTIVSKAFWQADAFLRENQRPHTSSLMVAGGWIEGLYISAVVGTKSKNKKLIKKMSEQTKSLQDLISLLEESKVGADATFVVGDLKELLTTYLKIENNTCMNDTVLNQIDKKVNDLRKKIVMQ